LKQVANGGSDEAIIVMINRFRRDRPKSGAQSPMTCRIVDRWTSFMTAIASDKHIDNHNDQLM
jgi:hypothetical protein